MAISWVDKAILSVYGCFQEHETRAKLPLTQNLRFARNGYNHGLALKQLLALVSWDETSQWRHYNNNQLDFVRRTESKIQTI